VCVCVCVLLFTRNRPTKLIARGALQLCQQKGQNFTNSRSRSHTIRKYKLIMKTQRVGNAIFRQQKLQGVVGL